MLKIELFVRIQGVQIKKSIEFKKKKKELVEEKSLFPSDAPVYLVVRYVEG